MRGRGGCGRGGAIGVAGFAATGLNVDTGAEAGVAACATGGVADVGCAGRGGTEVTPTTEGGAGGVGGGGTENVGLTVVVGTIIRGGGTAAGADTLGTTAFATGAAGLASAATIGRTAAGATTTGACCLRMAFSTSPGLDMLERSILVLISSASMRPGREGFEEFCAELAARINARTFSASWSSTELECDFFSVTPTSGSTSRIALLLTSSSLARSLIRILLIRSFFPPNSPLRLHINLTVSVLVCSVRRWRSA
jgi:hypothetical protein